MHEHAVSYNPGPFTDLPSDQAIEEAESAVTSLITRHEHDSGDCLHHHSAEELSGITLDVDPVPDPVPKRKPGIWWGPKSD